METVRFKKSGGPITVTITSGYAQTGSYTIKLKEKKTGKIVSRMDKDITDPPEIFTLPTPVSNNDGRKLQIIVTLMITPPAQYCIKMEIKQDDVVLGIPPKPNNSAANPTIIGIDIILKGEV